MVDSTTQLFVLAAAFQLFDGVQVVSTGVLRGAGETRLPMVVQPDRPLGDRPADRLRPGVRPGPGIFGLWVGLSVGLSLAGLANLATWARKSRRLKDHREPIVIA